MREHGTAAEVYDWWEATAGHVMNWVSVWTQPCGPWRRYLFSGATETIYHKLGGLNQQKLIPFQFWELKLQNQGNGRTLFPVKAAGEDRPLPSAGP